MDYSGFVKAYERFLTEDTAAPIRASYEKVETIHETDWVQILLVREITNDIEVKLVVEVSFPTWMQTLSLTRSSTEAEGDHTSRLRSVLHELIIHLEYLLKLAEAGFRLGVIVEEGFWTAWTRLSTCPSQQLFAALFSVNPP